MEEEVQKAGTTEAGNAGDDAEKTALTDAAEAGRDAETEEQKRTDWKARYLTETKPALEEKNRLAARIRELEEERAAKPSPTADASPGNADDLAALNAEVAETEALARNGDAAAKLSLRLLRDRLAEKQQQTLERQSQAGREADGEYLMTAMVTDDETGEERPLTAAERRELLKFQKTNARLFPPGAVEAAHDCLLGRKYREVRASLSKKEKAVSEATERRETQDVLRTGSRDVSAAEVRARKMTQAGYNEEYARRAARDDGSDFALAKELREGKVVIQR